MIQTVTVLILQTIHEVALVICDVGILCVFCRRSKQRKTVAQHMNNVAADTTQQPTPEEDYSTIPADYTTPNKVHVGLPDTRRARESEYTTITITPETSEPSPKPDSEDTVPEYSIPNKSKIERNTYSQTNELNDDYNRLDLKHLHKPYSSDKDYNHLANNKRKIISRFEVIPVREEELGNKPDFNHSKSFQLMKTMASKSEQDRGRGLLPEKEGQIPRKPPDLVMSVLPQRTEGTESVSNANKNFENPKDSDEKPVLIKTDSYEKLVLTENDSYEKLSVGDSNKNHKNDSSDKSMSNSEETVH